MYAIIETGGKQYRVAKDSIIDVEKLDDSGCEEITFNNVMMVASDDKVELGTPYLEGVKVIAQRLRDFKDKKIIAFKFRRRKSSKSKKGHRQQLSRVRIKEIQSS